ncbi:hypothetical protein [Pectobacterium polonicum]|uniref:hypothetical protein n=1 Tax=Pectobacterium polonicum TaxID=2485124 RepID=UPI002B243AA5|nr:hypothetical protein [Pectobacterium polonicum]
MKTITPHSNGNGLISLLPEENGFLSPKTHHSKHAIKKIKAERTTLPSAYGWEI